MFFGTLLRMIICILHLNSWGTMERNYLIVRRKHGSKPSSHQCTEQRIRFQKSSATKELQKTNILAAYAWKRSDDALSSFRASSFPRSHKRLIATLSVKCNFRDAHYSIVYVKSPNRQCVSNVVVVIVPNAASSRLQRLQGARLHSRWHNGSVDNGCWSGIGRFPAAIGGNEVCRGWWTFWRGSSFWGCVVVVVLVKWCDNATFRAVVSLCYGTVKLDCCIPRVQIGLAFSCLPPTKAVVPSGTPCTIVSCVFFLFFFAQAFVKCQKDSLLCRGP